ncbi:hypothetical protein [Rubinisphaera brasiliensis]|uniref:Uncharacterized protein n=1 Tax=Rubinisphaera brasiliensis (strain ATCC 49424 / DSM 5305 / JCM 21570 / IAM 15109 / NBRC 103401 / IFAM 1448) TaxID=756272 RepID=F0SKR7_RUBBR|nr:hypothetical protein [Rubinisphaera brasiliensis]ADY58737.1 hypothetical protein Plabr_1121 [Rubinisphaera brasiliensis DSM 5305]
MNRLYGLGEVTRITGVLRHRIIYALQNGYLPEPQAWISNKRAWSAEEVVQLPQYFGSKVDWDAAVRSQGEAVVRTLGPKVENDVVREETTILEKEAGRDTILPQ